MGLSADSPNIILDLLNPDVSPITVVLQYLATILLTASSASIVAAFMGYFNNDLSCKYRAMVKRQTYVSIASVAHRYTHRQDKRSDHGAIIDEAAAFCPRCPDPGFGQRLFDIGAKLGEHLVALLSRRAMRFALGCVSKFLDGNVVDIELRHAQNKNRAQINTGQESAHALYTLAEAQSINDEFVCPDDAETFDA